MERDGHPLPQISEGASTRYTHTDVDTPEREQACMVWEYTTLLEYAPSLRAQGLTGDFRVLAGHQTKFGIHFSRKTTWPPSKTLLFVPALSPSTKFSTRNSSQKSFIAALIP